MLKSILGAVLLGGCLIFGGSTNVMAACNNPEYRQFDFWIGTWHLRLPNGKLAGIDHVDREYEGCVIHERYATSGNYSGESLNIYDATRKVWHQTWVDSSGSLLVLEGGLRGNNMIMEGQTIGAHGVVKNRITWTPNADGSVRQLWESTDETGHWKVAFDSLFIQR